MAGKMPTLSNGPSALPNYPKYRSKSNRKLWSLHDRLAMSAHVLNANLAEDGCPKAQLDVAKKLLNDEDSVSPTTTQELRHENARLAIYWLIRSSSQGNQEATNLLRECYTTGRGITCQNILDVKTCLNTSNNDKLTFRAARLLYDKLRGSEDFISTTQIFARLQAKKFNKKVSFQNYLSTTENENAEEDGESDDTLLSHDLNETFTVCSETEDLLINQILSFSPSSPDGVKLTQDDLIKIATQYNAGQIPIAPINPENSLNTFKNWNLYSVSTAFLFQFLLFGVFAGAISQNWAIFSGISYMCLWSVYDYTLWRKRKALFQDWANAFKSVLQENGSWSEEPAYINFRKKYFYPSILISCFGILVLYFLDGNDGINMGKILLGTGTALAFSRPLQKWQLLLIFLLQLVQTELIAVLPTFELDIPIPLPDIGLTFSGIQTILFVHFLLDQRKHFTYEDFFTEATATAWIICTLQWFWQMPTSTTGSIYSFTNLLIGATILLLCISFYYEWKSLSLYKLLVAGLFIGMIILIAVRGMESSNSSNVEVTSEITLDWFEYQKNCHRPSWKSRTLLETEVNCMKNYYNFKVKWEGTIDFVKVKTFTTSSTFEPMEIEILINLITGYERQEFNRIKSVEAESNWSWKPFGTTSDKPSPHKTPILLVISMLELNDKEKSSIIEYLYNLRTGDLIEFTGFLNKKLGGFIPEVHPVQRINCHSCEILHTNEMINCISEPSTAANFIEENYAFIQEYYNRVKTLFWFYF